MATQEPRVPRVPSLVGGIPNKTDFAPSIIFAVAYGLTLIPFIYRFLHRDTRTIGLGLNTFIFAFERIVVYSIRASQSHDHQPGETLSKGFLIYQQVSFALGFIGFISDAIAWARAVLVNSTFADLTRGSQDDAPQRFRFRRFADVWGLMLLATTVTGAIAHSKYPSAANNQDLADKVYNLRYVSAAVAVALLLGFIANLRYIRSRSANEFLDKKALDFICLFALATTIMPIYRLAVMHNTTSFLNVLPSPPSPLYPSGSLTTPASKATFYIFQSLIELILAAVVQSMNVRAIFNTGMWGDWAGSDRPGIPRLRVKGVLVDGVGVKRGKAGAGPKMSIIGLIKGRWKKRSGANTTDGRVELTDEPARGHGEP